MKALVVLLSRTKLVLTASLLVSSLGLLFWVTMPRQEDPAMPDYWGQIVVSLPGSDAETVERQLLDPLEDELAAVDELREIEATAYAGLAHLHLELKEGVRDTDAAWDEVRRALERAARLLPEGSSVPVLDDDLQDQESIVLAFTGDPDVLRLQEAADSLRDQLLDLTLVSKVRRIADPGEQVTIAMTDEAATGLGYSIEGLARQLATRTTTVPGGHLRAGGYSITLRPQSEFRTIEEIRRTPILLADGSSVPLGAVASVQLEPIQPESARLRLSGEKAVGLGVVPREGVNLEDFGRQVRSLVAAQEGAFGSTLVQEVIFQPERVGKRLSGLGASLLMGILIVAGMLLLFMGPRVGLLVASVVPLVVLSSLAVFALFGGTLQQISVAALVIALGMLVDNAIVMTESMQWRIDQGESTAEAAVGSVRELVVPLAAATATTLAVFVPMMLSRGATAEFTRSIPIVIMITLTMSYLYAIFFTPAVARLVLVPGNRAQKGKAILDWISNAALSHRRKVLVGASLILVASFVASRGIQQEFFPASDRNQFLVEIELSEGSHLDATTEAAALVEQALLNKPEVTRVLSTIGRSAPHFYYNLSQIPWSPHLAQIVVETQEVSQVDPLISWLRDWAPTHLPEAQFVAKPLEQGPPVLAPIELRLVGEKLEDLAVAADRVTREVQRVSGTVDVRHDLGPGAPLLRFRIDDAAAGRRGVDRLTIAQSLFVRTRGLRLGELRSSDDPIPILIRSVAGEEYDLDQLSSLDLRTGGSTPLPLAQVATPELAWRPAAIHHRNRQRVVRVLSQLEPGRSYTDVLRVLQPKLAALELPDSVALEYGGALEGSGEANMAMLRTLPIGVLLLFGILLAEFNSFRRLAIILATVPLSAAGVVPGLLIARQPFGFMSLLGIIALVGVVVNNAIVLLDLIESERASGATVEQAIKTAVARRTRPILLTSATTVAGLVPLAFSSTSLWPPLAWAMISGLLASTGLTLLVVPALYLTWLGESAGSKARGEHRKTVQAAAILMIVLIPAAGLSEQSLPSESSISESPWTLEKVVEAAQGQNQAMASKRRTSAARQESESIRRQAWLPTVEGLAGVGTQERDAVLETPFGPLDFGSSKRRYASLGLRQSLFDPTRGRYRIPAAQLRAQSSESRELWIQQQVALESVEVWLSLREIDARMDSDERLEESLRSALAATEARVRAGRELDVSATKIRLAFSEVSYRRATLRDQRSIVAWHLAYLVGADPALESFEELGSIKEYVEVLSQPQNEAVDEALAGRPDLRGQQEELEAMALELGAIKAGRWPRLEAQVAAQWDTASPFSEKSWLEGGLQFSWRPLQPGRGQKIRTKALQEEAARFEVDHQRAEIERQVRKALVGVTIAFDARRLAESSFSLAEETVRVERVRYDNGRITANDLLAAESLLAQKRSDRTLATLGQVRARYQLELVLGRRLN